MQGSKHYNSALILKFPADLVTFTEEILNGKLHFLCTVILSWRWFLSYRNQSIDLFCKSMYWFLYRDLRHERFKTLFINIHWESCLHVIKHNLLFLFFFLSFFSFYFLSQIFTIHKAAGEGGGYILMSLLPLPPASQTLRDINWVALDIAAESSPLEIAGSRNRAWKLCYTLFRTHSFYTCTGSCCC